MYVVSAGWQNGVAWVMVAGFATVAAVSWMPVGVLMVVALGLVLVGLVALDRRDMS